MKKNNGITIVIPAFNEGKIIRQVIQIIRQQGYNSILVVDDGSDDDTYSQALKETPYVLRHILNRGKGAAVKTGMEAAKLLNSDMVVTCDADGQHDPQEIPVFVNIITEKHFDIVLGSRFLGKKQTMPFVKQIANQIGNFITWLLYGIWVSDSQSGFRAYSRRALDVIDTRHDRYEYDSEIIREISKNNLKYCEIPIRSIYTSYSQNKTTKQSFTNGIKTLIKMIIS